MKHHFQIGIIEDHPSNAELLTQLFLSEIYAVKHWEAARDAWNGVNNNDPMDLVVLDLDVDQNHSRSVNYFQLLDHIRVRWNSSRVIALTALNKQELAERGRLIRAHATVHKPYNIRNLFKLSHNLLEDMLSENINDLNSQHRSLAYQFRRLINTSPGADSKPEAVLQNLHDHFRFEETFMTRHNYPDRGQHASNHLKILEKAKQILHRSNTDTESLQRLWREVSSDVNDDQSYMQFLEEIHKSLMEQSLSEPNRAAV